MDYLCGVTGGNSVQVFYCEPEKCALSVISVYCNDEALLNNGSMTECSVPPPHRAVCQHDGRAFVSMSGNAHCEFEGNSGYITTKNCSGIYIF